MIDISEILAKAVLVRERWTEAAAHDFFKSVAKSLFADIDWDEDAGEQWARFVRGNAVVALAWVPAPLLLADAELAPDLGVLAASEMTVLLPSLTAVGITAGPQILLVAFGDRAQSVALDVSSFSAEDLWYATV